MGSTSNCASVHVKRIHGHVKWSKNISPVLTISSGEAVTFDAIDSSNGQIAKTSDPSTLCSVDFGLVNPVFGPVYVRDAQPGDVLKIEVEDLQTADWGWSAIIPGFGLLADEFPNPALNIWRLDKKKGYTFFKDGIRVPMRPFLGCMGVAPASDEELSTVPPTAAGGNMDCRELCVGSTVYLPVLAPGALFSCGDGHAAQGHGEVCGTAIETPITATLRFEVCKNQPWVTSPQYRTPPSSQMQNPIQDLGYYAATGIHSDLLEATKQALRNLLRWLMATKGLDRSEAYILASVVGDLQITEAVNMPNYEVSMSIPLGIFA